MQLSKVLLVSLSAMLLLVAVSSDEEATGTQGDCAEGEEGCNIEQAEEEAEEAAEEEQPLIAPLTDQDFLETVKAADMMVVVFYAPW